MIRKVLATTIFMMLATILFACQQDDVELGSGQTAHSADLELQPKGHIVIHEQEDPNQTDPNGQEEDSQKPETDENEAITVSDPDAIDVIVNKERKLPDGYEPPDLIQPNVDFHATNEERKYMREEAAHALEELFQAASEEGHDLVAISGYRSYGTQEAVFAMHVSNNGREYAEQYSAVPGHSEHQTGLAMDISTESLGYSLTEDLSDTAEGQWVAEHGHEYGFIIRYPEGKSHITGYNYEPWHLRYFGDNLATAIYESGLTVEEYFGMVE
ncbi:M15 family metallopeptidase [Alkalibacillus aidingensis]|uniref:M15 family metallopeptidase n=1 Tax=Alkalibacillus aidingensis TaxID=2747607 RepID=UPI001660204F|nr:M15 family metallopeptidase [Alkalibacillus aidingensis]